MDILSVLADFEDRADREGLDTDSFKLFLLLLANYDCRKRSGVIRRDTIAAAFGEEFISTAFNRASLRLSGLGLLTIVSPQRIGTAQGDSAIIYGIPPMEQGEGD